MSALCTVRLVDVPVDLLFAMNEHHSDILRESALMAIGAETGTTAPGENGPLGRLVTMLNELRQRFAAERSFLHEAMAAAERDGQSIVTLEIVLPRDVADSVEVLLATFEEADEYCRAGDLLTLASSPEVAALRRRLLTDVVTQLRSSASAP